MSGGNFDYAQDRLFDELFPDVPGFARYDLEGHPVRSSTVRYLAYFKGKWLKK